MCRPLTGSPVSFSVSFVFYTVDMTTSRPYLIRAIHEWLLDNDMTPYMLVDIEGEGVDVPRQHGQNGKIVLNISPHAVEGLMLGNDAIGFRARFGGIATDVYVPVDAVLAIYSRENGRGMVFSEDEPEPHDPSPEQSRKPSLKVVK